VTSRQVLRLIASLPLLSQDASAYAVRQSAAIDVITKDELNGADPRELAALLVNIMEEKRVRPAIWLERCRPCDLCAGFAGFLSCSMADFPSSTQIPWQRRSSPQCMEAGPTFSVSTGWGFNDEGFAWASLLLSGLVPTQKPIPTQLQTRKNRQEAVRSSVGNC